jgi:hypothetical protein
LSENKEIEVQVYKVLQKQLTLTATKEVLQPLPRARHLYSRSKYKQIFRLHKDEQNKVPYNKLVILKIENFTKFDLENENYV